MFAWNMLKCLKIFSRTYVSSDDNFILDYAEEKGAIPIKRPKELCGDVPNILVYQHAIQFMNGVDGIVAIQANSPTINAKLIIYAKRFLEKKGQEFMTSHKDGSIYGSIWALSIDRLNNYKDPYKPKPEKMILDESVDIHDYEDFLSALNQVL